MGCSGQTWDEKGGVWLPMRNEGLGLRTSESTVTPAFSQGLERAIIIGGHGGSPSRSLSRD